MTLGGDLMQMSPGTWGLSDQEQIRLPTNRIVRESDGGWLETVVLHPLAFLWAMPDLSKPINNLGYTRKTEKHVQIMIYCYFVYCYKFRFKLGRAKI
jgi:hypothetical protein